MRAIPNELLQFMRVCYLKIHFRCIRVRSMNFPTRVCTECGRTYQPSSGHHQCPSCRSHDLCACGAKKQVHSATCSACRSEKGESNSNWRGGRTRHKKGYIMLRVPGHPRAGAGNGNYVFEHVLVMEQVLDRVPGLSETA
jgi:hypothetical protein